MSIQQMSSGKGRGFASKSQAGREIGALKKAEELAELKRKQAEGKSLAEKEMRALQSRSAMQMATGKGTAMKSGQFFGKTNRMRENIAKFESAASELASFKAGLREDDTLIGIKDNLKVTNLGIMGKIGLDRGFQKTDIFVGRGGSIADTGWKTTLPQKITGSTSGIFSVSSPTPNRIEAVIEGGKLRESRHYADAQGRQLKKVQYYDDLGNPVETKSFW